MDLREAVEFIEVAVETWPCLDFCGDGQEPLKAVLAAAKEALRNREQERSRQAYLEELGA